MKNKKGFTLIELLVVIVILAILAVAAYTIIGPRLDQARKRTFISDVSEVVKAYQLYCNSNSCTSPVDVGTLVSSGYLQKQGYDANKFKGSVQVIGKLYYINLTNGEYSTNGLTKVSDVSEQSIIAGDSGATNINDLTDQENYMNYYTCEALKKYFIEVRLDGKNGQFTPSRNQCITAEGVTYTATATTTERYQTCIGVNSCKVADFTLTYHCVDAPLRDISINTSDKPNFVITYGKSGTKRYTTGRVSYYRGLKAEDTPTCSEVSSS